MKKLIPILLLITIIVSCIFAFTACSQNKQDGIVLLDEWEYSIGNHNGTLIKKKKYILELIAKSSCDILQSNIDGESATINLTYNINYKNSPSEFCAGDKIRFEVDCLADSKLNKAEIILIYKSAKTETLIYKF